MVQSVLDEALQTLGVPKEYTEAELAKVETAVPNVVGSSVNAAAGKLRESGFNVDIERATGDTVLYQYPAAGTIVPRQSTIILYSEDRSESGGDLVTVPNLTDMSYDAACATLKSLGLNVSEKGVTGGGKTIVVTEQDIAADTQVEIASGISAGDEVILNPQDGTEGMAVSSDPAAAAQMPADAGMGAVMMG